MINPKALVKHGHHTSSRWHVLFGQAYDCIISVLFCFRVYFLLFLINLVFSAYVAIFLAKHIVDSFGWTALRILFALLYGIFGPMFGFMLLTTVRQELNTELFFLQFGLFFDTLNTRIPRSEFEKVLAIMIYLS